MAATDLSPGITSSKLATSRLGTHVLSSGTPGGEPVILIHGNVSSGRFYEELMAAMPPRYQCLGAGPARLRRLGPRAHRRDARDARLL